MWVLKTSIGVIHSIEGKIACMWTKVEFHDKKWEQIKCCINRVYTPFSHCYLYIFVAEYTYGFIFQDKVKCTSFNVNLKHQYQNVINKIIFAKNKIHKVCAQLPNSYYYIYSSYVSALLKKMKS